MPEEIYYNKINLDDEGNFEMDITKDNVVDKKSFWLTKNEYLVSGLSVKPVRNNDITKWDDFDNSLWDNKWLKKIKKELFDLTQTVSLDDEPKVPWEENLRLVKSTRKENVRILQHKKVEKRSNNIWRLQRDIFEQKIKT